MRPLHASELLTVWEEGLDQPLLEKTLRLLGRACSVDNPGEIGRLSIGERDVRLLALREWMFGPTLRNVANCPVCKQPAEWETSTGNLRLQTLPADLTVKTFLLEKDDFTIRFRLPDSQDVSKAIIDPAYRSDEKKILLDCILEASDPDGKCDPRSLPDPVWDTLAQRMSEEDPQADIRMNIRCPSCSYEWEVRFDIMSFLWAEIHNWAHRILQEVFTLGRSFGWSEKDILNMSDRRRQTYLQLLTT
jgi:hypothetical protein